ncbi:hypothetical protein Micbo1qcDRAFT_167327, partial [Microdochium bolleyi]
MARLDAWSLQHGSLIEVRRGICLVALSLLSTHVSRAASGRQNTWRLWVDGLYRAAGLCCRSDDCALTLLYIRRLNGGSVPIRGQVPCDHQAQQSGCFRILGGTSQIVLDLALPTGWDGLDTRRA